MISIADVIVHLDVVNGYKWNYTISDRGAMVGGESLHAIVPNQIGLSEYSARGAIRIPTHLGGLPVVGINPDAFSGCAAITEITIPEGVVDIGKQAFLGCSGLTKLIIPNGVVNIGEKAFKDCTGLKEVTMPPSIKNVGNGAFYNAGWSKKVYISDLAAWCNVHFVGRESNPLWTTRGANDGLYLDGGEVADLVIPESVTDICDYAFYACYGIKSVKFPSTLRSIGESAFYGCSQIENLDFPSTLRTIGSSAFSGCSGISSPLVIPDGMVSMGARTFYSCAGLPSVVIPSSVKGIGYGAFYGCANLKAVHIDDLASWCEIDFGFDADSAGIGASSNPLYYAKKLFLGEQQVVNLVVPDGVGAINAWAFAGCRDLLTIEIPSNVTNIGMAAFSGCASITNVEIPLSVTSIGTAVFSGCTSITNIVLPFIGERRGHSEIPERDLFGWIFGSDSSQNVRGTVQKCWEGGYESWENGHELQRTYYIPESIKSVRILDDTSIEYGAFSGCSMLFSIQIPSSVRYIGGRAFAGCDSIVDIVIPSSVTSIAASALNDTPFMKAQSDGVIVKDGCLLCVKGGCPSDIVIPTGVRIIADDAFNGMGMLRSVIVPETVRSIGRHAFEGCENIGSLELPEGVVSVDRYAFENCSGLELIAIPTTLKSVGYGAFIGCKNISRVQIQNLCHWCGIAFEDYSSNPLRYGRSLYLGDVELVDLTLPEGLLSIGSYAFYHWDGQSLSIPSSVINIGHSAFRECRSLKKVTIESPAKEKEIDYDTFYYCTDLVSVTIPNSVTNIMHFAFDGCDSLSLVYVNKGDSERVAQMLSKSGFQSDALRFVEIDEDALPWLDAAATKKDIETILLGFSDSKLIDGIVDAESYNLYRNWATDVGVSAVKESKAAWVSFALNSTELLAKNPTDEDLIIEEFKPSNESGKFDFTVRVKDVEIGSEALAENLKKVFGLAGATTLDAGAFKQENVDLEFDAPKDGKLRFTAKPTKMSDRFFMRVKVK